MELQEQVKQQRVEQKKRRLLLYEARIFELQMDVAALQAVGDDEAAGKKSEEVDSIRKAYAAVEALRDE